MDELILTVTGMSCAHCVDAITAEVAKVGGVQAVDVDLDTRLVTVSGDGVAREAVVAAIDEAGYDVAGESAGEIAGTMADGHHDGTIADGAAGVINGNAGAAGVINGDAGVAGVINGDAEG